MPNPVKPALVSGPVRHLIKNYGSGYTELRWWVRCAKEHLLLIDEDQVFGKAPIHCESCQENFIEDFSTHSRFNMEPVRV